jgi:hypothetical protein
MEDCAIETSPENSGSLAGDGLNTDVASGHDGGKVAPPGSSHEVVDLDDDFLRRCHASLGLGVQQSIVLPLMRLKYFRTREQERGLLS